MMESLAVNLLQRESGAHLLGHLDMYQTCNIVLISLLHEREGRLN